MSLYCISVKSDTELMETTPLLFGSLVRRAWLRWGLTHDLLAERVGSATATIRKIEAGERRPLFQMALRLAQMLDVPTAEHQAFIDTARTAIEPADHPADSLGEREIQRRAQPLPTYLTPLIGRVQAQADLLRLLAISDCRLVTVLGAGGIGKTRFAIEVVANALTTTALEGFVPLASVGEVAAVIPAIADALGLSFSGNTDLLSQLNEYLRPRQIILVLDSMEHLVSDPGLPRLLANLLSEALDLRLLVTSRERLRLSGEWVIELGGLSVPSDPTGKDAEQAEAVMLFLERARRMGAGFTLDSSNRVAIAQICRLLDGVPLAIELAATWVPLLSCAEIADEIERSLDFLSQADRDLPPAHRSMRAVFEHSWGMLDADEQLILAKLSVFRHGFTRDAAEDVAGATLRHLATFVTKSLMAQTKIRRYDMHTLLRQFVFEKLST